MADRYTVCVFCASSDAADPDERAVAAALGQAIAARGWSLVYGGGGIGLMGEVARAALAGGAHVTGVIPHRLNTREVAFDGVSELIRTDTMRQRKAIMDARADAFCVLPGGIGTLEELLEVLTLRQLGYHDRPIVLLDATGYWAPLRAQLERMVERGLARPSVRRLWATATTVPDAVRALASAPTMEGAPGAADGTRTEAVEAMEAMDVVEDPPR